jgi:hypothetical protein
LFRSLPDVNLCLSVWTTSIHSEGLAALHGGRLSAQERVWGDKRGCKYDWLFQTQTLFASLQSSRLGFNLSMMLSVVTVLTMM